MGSIAVINFISRQKTQTRQGLKALLDYCSRNAKTTYNGIRLVTGINCVAQSAYNEMMNDARALATKRMAAEAEELGADAIVNIRYSSSAIMQGAAEVIAYGTAVKFK